MKVNMHLRIFSTGIRPVPADKKKKKKNAYVLESQNFVKLRTGQNYLDKDRKSEMKRQERGSNKLEAHPQTLASLEPFPVS